MLFQPTHISPDEVNGTGAADITDGLTISWCPRGDNPMIAYEIKIYLNDSASTLKYDTGKQETGSNIWGVDYKGDEQLFSVTIPYQTLTASGISNGNEYKLIIRQYWTQSDYIDQTTASVFRAEAKPTLSLNTIPSPLEAFTYSFFGNYNQVDGVPIRWLRWQIATKSGAVYTTVYDTGRISGTGQLRCTYYGFLNDTTYGIRLDVENDSGFEVTTGWVDFTVSYSSSSALGTATACQLRNEDCIQIQWTAVDSAQRYAVFRKLGNESKLSLAAIVDSGTTQLKDYAICSGNKYTYYVFPVGTMRIITQAMITSEVSVTLWVWTIIEASLNSDKKYTVQNTYRFKYGVTEGGFSNNNNPTIQKNFTRYPTRQAESSNYLTGSVSGLIGTITKAVYKDTLSQAKALRELSTSTNELFLIDPKGHFLKIETSEPTTLTINQKSPLMPQTVGITWTEVGETDEVSLTDAEYATWTIDEVIYTHFRVSSDGVLRWDFDAPYSGTEMIGIDENGLLKYSQDGEFTPATMARDGVKVTATL